MSCKSRGPLGAIRTRRLWNYRANAVDEYLEGFAMMHPETIILEGSRAILRKDYAKMPEKVSPIPCFFFSYSSWIRYYETSLIFDKFIIFNGSNFFSKLGIIFLRELHDRIAITMQVKLISGGGAGNEPAHVDFIGPGMLGGIIRKCGVII